MRLLKFVLRNSYFTYEKEPYHQTFGCAMGSPVSATIANLVMEFVEKRAISTATHDGGIGTSMTATFVCQRSMCRSSMPT